ncbi:MAG: PilZ domain-containing protein [Candidatus Omnitrophota bacterium]|jgi:c-di-GMP-binding flagellar brake protein YcgR
MSEQERRKFIRLDYSKPLAYKVCRKETLTKLLNGYTSNVSEAGLQCVLKGKVNPGDVLWLSFDRSVLLVCQEMEKRTLVYQGGIVGNTVWVEERSDNSYNVGIQFITREEKNNDHIYPQVHFIELHLGENPQGIKESGE